MICRQAVLCTAMGIGIFAAGLAHITAQTSASTVDVPTNRKDNYRSGASLREPILETKTVCQTGFGKIFEREVDGDIYAQKLVKTHVNIPNVGQRDLVFVATVN